MGQGRVKIVRLGSKYRVIVASILDVLGYLNAPSAGTGTHPNAVPKG